MRAFAVLLAGFLAACALPAFAQVSVDQAWVRGTVPGQKASGAYMRLKSPTDAALVAVSTPAAKVSEVHEMAMEGGVMKMRPVARLPLPAGKVVELAPNGYHVMLMELVRPLKAGDAIALTLTFQDSNGARSTVKVDAKVGALTGENPHPSR